MDERGTIVEERDPSVLLDTPLEELPKPPAPSAPVEEREPQEEPQVNVLLTCLAVFLSASAAGWMCAGIFHGALAKIIGFLGPLIGTGFVALSYRMRRPSVLQYLAFPAAVLAGAVLVMPDATGGTANLPGLVQEAIRTGGVAQPPIPFDPGWRFILVVLTAVLGAAGASLATGLNRPKLGIFLPAPVIFGVAMVQPKEGTVTTTAIALVLLIGSLAVSYGVELQREGATSGQFELRRLGKGAGIVALLVGALLALSQAGFLFPETDREQVVPPKRPESQPPQADRVLFTVEADRPGPWRLGVLDVYQDNAWMLPPFDTGRFLEIPANGRILPAPASVEGVPPAVARPAGETRTGSFVAHFVVTDIEGHVVPSIAGAMTVSRGTFFKITEDPRTGMLRLPDTRARRGMDYVVVAPLPPTAQQMAAAPPAPEAFAKIFTDVPPAPIEVQRLLAVAPKDNPFVRLQFVRNAFYQKVVAAGSGEPIDVPPGRVVDMLEGGEGTPWEITAAEALLARWAGIPARIGYGHYAGKKTGLDDKSYEVRPGNGATWLEAYFHGYGWVPIVGTPPKAKASLSQQQKQEDPEIRPTEELALVVYVPVKLQSFRLLFVVVRYWVAVTLPFIILALLLWGFYPGLLKVIRRFKRRRWAAGHGVSERILVAYSEFRDATNDLNVGDPSATPLEFLDSIESDAEHAELGWLVTRALWGDLMRDLRTEDAEVAQDMATSMMRRLRRAAPAITRVLALGSRASLRDPYTVEIPNVWPAWAQRGAIRRAVRRRLAFLGAVRRLRRLIPVGGMIAVAVLLVACGGTSSRAPVADLVRPVLPDPIVPDRIQGLLISREQDAELAYERAGASSLVAEGRVFTLRDGKDVKGALQVGAFKPGLKATEREIREGVLGNIGTGTFELTRIGQFRVFVQQSSEQRIFLWFPPRMQYYELFVARQGFDDADQIFTAILAFQRGEEVIVTEQRSGIPDARRGVPA